MLFRTEMLAFATSLVCIKVYFSLCVGGFKKLIDAPREIADLVRNDGWARQKTHFTAFFVVFWTELCHISPLFGQNQVVFCRRISWKTVLGHDDPNKVISFFLQMNHLSDFPCYRCCPLTMWTLWQGLWNSSYVAVHSCSSSVSYTSRGVLISQHFTWLIIQWIFHVLKFFFLYHALEAAFLGEELAKQAICCISCCVSLCLVACSTKPRSHERHGVAK